MSTAADELRVAARVLRALLADRELTPGPWLSMDRGDRLLWNGEGAEDEAPVYVVDEPMSNGANADYIAVMHPDVGHALVELLDTAADYVADDSPTHPTHVVRALAVARQINGGQP